MKITEYHNFGLQPQETLFASSRITFVYKVLIPLIGGAGLAIYFMWALTRGEMLDLFIPLGLFFTALWIVMVIIGVVIVEVKVNVDTIEVVNYGNKNSKSVKDVESIDRFLINFYRITFSDGTKKLFIPHISEVLLNPFSEPESIIELRKMLDIAE